MGVNSVIF